MKLTHLLWKKLLHLIIRGEKVRTKRETATLRVYIEKGNCYIVMEDIWKSFFKNLVYALIKKPDILIKTPSFNGKFRVMKSKDF